MAAIGRPTKLTPEVHQTIVQAVGVGLSLTDAAVAAGVSLGAVMEWKRRGADGEEPFAQFLQDVRASQKRGELAALANIRAAGKDPKHWQANAWYLERTRPKKYAPKVHIHVQEELSSAIERLRKALAPAEFERALLALSSGDSGAGATENPSGAVDGGIVDGEIVDAPQPEPEAGDVPEP